MRTFTSETKPQKNMHSPKSDEKKVVRIKTVHRRTQTAKGRDKQTIRPQSNEDLRKTVIS